MSGLSSEKTGLTHYPHSMNILIYTDGGAKGNPGPAAIGIVAYADALQKASELFRYREDIGKATNNEAEYRAIIKALELLPEKIKQEKMPQPERVEFYSDSMLVVKQLNGEYKIKKAHIRELIFAVRAAEAEIGVPITYHYIPREENTLADALVNDMAPVNAE